MPANLLIAVATGALLGLGLLQLVDKVTHLAHLIPA